MYIEVTKDNFDSEVVKSDKPVIVDFWAEWCGPCRMMSPIIEEISDERDDVKVCKVNVDDEPELADRFGISAIPTVALFKGEPAAFSVGFKEKDELLKALGI